MDQTISIPDFLKELIDHISHPVTLLNKTMEYGKIPKEWKQANVSPIFKKGQKHLAENYRPITLTSVVCKLMETVVKQKIMAHLIDLDLLSSKQFGFISSRSTTTQLLNYLDKCIKVMVIEVIGVVDSIYLDFANAFDSVTHQRLIMKIESYSIQGDIRKWIEAFLSRRTHKS